MLANYQELKKANRHFPILVREASSAEAALTARYGVRHTCVYDASVASSFTVCDTVVTCIYCAQIWEWNKEQSSRT